MEVCDEKKPCNSRQMHQEFSLGLVLNRYEREWIAKQMKHQTTQSSDQ